MPSLREGYVSYDRGTPVQSKIPAVVPRTYAGFDLWHFRVAVATSGIEPMPDVVKSDGESVAFEEGIRG